MNKILSLFLFVLAISCSTQKKDITIITGKVIDSDGNPISNTYIEFGFDDKIKPISLTQKDNGTYEITTDYVAYMNIKFSGVNHHSTDLPFLFSNPEKIKVNVQLVSNDQNNDSQIEFIDGQSISSKYHAISVWLNKYKQQHDLEEVGEEIFRKISVEQDINIKSLLCYSYMINLFNTRKVDPAKAREILQIMPPASIVWDMNPNYLTWFYFILPAEDQYLLDAYIEKVSKENIYPRVRSEAIAYFLFSAEMEKDSLKIQKYYNRLISECPETFRARDARFKYEILAPGKKVPSFSVTLIDDPKVTYTDKSMLGKVYLIEFWATTCCPCKREMPYLHDAFKKYKSKEFEILSFSLDDSPARVIEYCKGEWKMPWHHVFLEGEFDHEVSKKFGVMGTPTPILVDSEGKIIATGNALRSDDLLETLSDYFEK